MKPGHQTSEFWASMAAAILPHFIPGVSAAEAVAISGAVTGLYTVSRGHAKNGAPRPAKKASAPAA